MNDKIYTPEQYNHAVTYIGKKVFFFIKTSLPQVEEGQVWSLLPTISVDFGSTVITGVTADIKKVSNGDGTTDEYKKLQFVLMNPYYIKEDEPDGEVMGFPKSAVNSWKEWHFAYATLNKWFFETKELATKSISDYNHMYYDHQMK